MAADTKEHILDAAEGLIADQGIDAVSLRAITSAAKVNLAAVHYHFGCKEALVQKVFERRIRPVNERRLELLDKAEREAGGGSAVPLETILRAFIQPAIRLYASDPKGQMFMRVCGRIYAEPSMQIKKSLDDSFTELVSRFVAAFQRTLPEVEPDELNWRIHFMIGAMIHTLMDNERLKRFTKGQCAMNDPEALIDRLIAFSAAGMRAPRARAQEPAAAVLLETPL
ncbi:MAG: TetR/AcrR family transcriptional regulator [Bryobacterales bacterium]|nr:TetR/AcrR family transcriptional regulator [Bryobacterales bacterium]